MIKVTIKTDNAAFGDDEHDRYAEVARILRELADDLDGGGMCLPANVRDYDGNVVGSIEEK